jgi:hypothetical protein
MSKKNLSKIICGMPLLLLSACGGFSSGESGGLISSKYGADQIVEVRTSPENTEASIHCLLENNKGSWDIQNAPEHVDVKSAKGALYVTCKGAMGYNGRVRVTSDVKVIGLLDEVVFGSSMWKYPDVITVPLTRDTSHDVTDAIAIPPHKVETETIPTQLNSSVSSLKTHKRIHHIHPKKDNC